MGGWGSVLQPPFFPTSLKPLVCCYVGLVDMWASLRKNKEVSTLANVGWTKNSRVSLCVKNCLCVSVCVRGGVKSSHGNKCSNWNLFLSKVTLPDREFKLRCWRENMACRTAGPVCVPTGPGSCSHTQPLGWDIPNVAVCPSAEGTVSVDLECLRVRVE